MGIAIDHRTTAGLRRFGQSVWRAPRSMSMRHAASICSAVARCATRLRRPRIGRPEFAGAAGGHARSALVHDRKAAPRDQPIVAATGDPRPDGVLRPSASSLVNGLRQPDATRTGLAGCPGSASRAMPLVVGCGSQGRASPDAADSALRSAVNCHAKTIEFVGSQRSIRTTLKSKSLSTSNPTFKTHAAERLGFEARSPRRCRVRGGVRPLRAARRALGVARQCALRGSDPAALQAFATGGKAFTPLNENPGRHCTPKTNG